MGDRQAQPWVRTLLVLWLAELFAIMGMSLVIPFLPLYLQELNVPPQETRLWAGWVGGANFLCAAVTAPLWGTVGDRFGRKLMALRALVGLAVAVALMGLAQNVYQLFCLRLLQGAFGGFVAAAIALAGTFVPRDRLGGALGFLQTAVVGGNLVGPVLGGELSHHFGYRATFLITGGALFVAMLLVLFLVPEKHTAAEETKPRSVRDNMRELLAIPQVRMMGLLIILSQAGLMLVNPQISLFVKDLVRQPEDVNRLVGLAIAAPALPSFLLATFWGRLGDRRGYAAVLVFTLTGAALVIPWAALATAFWHLLVLRLCLGAFTAAFNPAAHSVVAHRVPEQRIAGAFSVLSSAQMLGACLGPFISGPLAATFGVRPLFPVTGALLLGAAITAARVWKYPTTERSKPA